MTIAEKIALPEAEKQSAGHDADKSPDKRRALGRGLDSLLPARPRVVPSIAPAVISGNRESAISGAEGAVLTEVQAARASDGEVEQVPLDNIDENPYQTRRSFDENALQELSQSIRSNGLLQPIVVRPGANGRYVLVLGARRCQASKMAGKTTIPATVRAVSDQQAAEMTVVENLMRQDLNCLEQANAFSRLSKNFGLTQEQIGARIGVSRESVSNYMRLLRLPDRVQELLSDGRLGFSEARVLLQLSNTQQIETIADLAAQKQFSVTELQNIVDNAISLNEGPQRVEPDKVPQIDPNVRAAQSELEAILGLRVKISDRKGKGKITISYSNLDDFDRIFEMLKKAD